MAASMNCQCLCGAGRSYWPKLYHRRFLLNMYTPLAVRSSSTTKKKQNNMDYCVNMVRRLDYENYLCTLLYPASYRSAAFALRAFNVELAQVHDVTTDQMRAVMRMTFWRDAVDHIFKGHPPQTPVSLEIGRAVEKHKLSKHWFSKIVEARYQSVKQFGSSRETDNWCLFWIQTDCIWDHDQESTPRLANQDSSGSQRSLQDIENHGESTMSALNYLLLECAGVKNVHADHAASHLGRAQSLVTLLRATPFHASRHKIFLPTELLIKHSVSEEEVCRASQDQKVKDVMFDIASRAHQQLNTARDLKKDVPKEAFPVFLTSVICDQYLKKLQLADFNIFDKSLQKKNGLLPFQLSWQNMKRTY